MEKTKQTSVYLEDVHSKYLDIMSLNTGLNKSQLIRDMIDNDIEQNKDSVKKYEKILFKTL
jgi:predicted DNA-binding protein